MRMRRSVIFPKCSAISKVAILGLALLPSIAHPGEGAVDRTLPPYEPEGRLTGSLHSVGSNTMDVITFGWIQLFRKAHPEVEATMEARTSLMAAPALTSGLAQVTPIGREFQPSEVDAFRRKFGYEPTLVRVAVGSHATDRRSHALAVYVHRDNPVQKMSLAQVEAIYAVKRKRGQPNDITKWGDLGLSGEWRDRPITIYSMRRPNGIVTFFQERVMLGGEFKPTIRERFEGSDAGTLSAVVKSVSGDPNGIGFAGFGHGTPEVRALSLAETQDGPFVVGSLESIADHSYPLARWVYIAVNRAPGKPLSPQIKEFLKLVLSREGQEVVAGDGAFLPLPASVVREELKKIE